ncbi:MAG TPA: glycerol-3-phosphate cytidylyltransferase [Planctomycetes bacterium]|nr:glycerol-3-phosphate cytidylyltransferase [Planctomycetota bacterium]
MIVGYTTGVFDLFHIGHLNILRNARAMCDRLIVGVTTDELLEEYKGKHPVIPFEERIQIVRAIEHVDVAVAQESMNKFEVWKKMQFDIMFVGDDWHQTPQWEIIEAKFSEVGVRIAYFPYTRGTSSTLINDFLQKEREKSQEPDTVKE